MPTHLAHEGSMFHITYPTKDLTFGSFHRVEFWETLKMEDEMSKQQVVRESTYEPLRILLRYNSF